MRERPAKYRGAAATVWRQVFFYDIYDSSPEGALYHIIHQGEGGKLLPLTAVIHKGEVKNTGPADRWRLRNTGNILIHWSDWSDIVEVASPISAEHTMLRCSILPNLLEILSLNKHRDLPQRIFEVGPVVLNFKEKYRLAGVSTHANAKYPQHLGGTLMSNTS